MQSACATIRPHFQGSYIIQKNQIHYHTHLFLEPVKMLPPVHTLPAVDTKCMLACDFVPAAGNEGSAIL